MKREKLAIHCIAPDGEYVTEGRDFPDTDTAWQRVNDMGSRWFFYPIPVVTSTGPAAIIRDVPEGMPKEWIGKRFAALLLAIAADPDDSLAYANGDAPFCIYP